MFMAADQAPLASAWCSTRLGPRPSSIHRLNYPHFEESLHLLTSRIANYPSEVCFRLNFRSSWQNSSRRHQSPSCTQDGWQRRERRSSLIPETCSTISTILNSDRRDNWYQAHRNILIHHPIGPSVCSTSSWQCFQSIAYCRLVQLAQPTSKNIRILSNHYCLRTLSFQTFKPNFDQVFPLSF